MMKKIFLDTLIDEREMEGKNVMKMIFLECDNDTDIIRYITYNPEVRI